MISRINLALVHNVDQMLDFYELKQEYKPEAITIKQETYEALLAFENDGRSTPYMQLTHYRGIALNIVK